MTREQKAAAIADLKEKFENSQYFYITDSSALSVAKVNELRRLCFEKNVQMHVVKNTLAVKALESAPEDRGFEKLYDVLKGPSTILISEVGNVPAKLIEEFRKKNPKPLLKAAYIDTDVFIGDEQVSVLAKLKSKEDLLGEVITLLQSPAKNVISSLKSGGSTLSGLLKALEERA